MNEKIVGGLTSDAVFFETVLRKMLRVLGNDGAGSSHDGSGQDVPVVIVRNAFDGSQQLGRNGNHGLGKCLDHLLPSPSGLGSRAVELCSQGFGHLGQNVFAPNGTIGGWLFGEAQQ